MTVEKKKKTLGEYFSRYMPVSQAQRELFALAENVRIRAAQELKMVEVNFTLPKLFRKSVLYETEAALTEFYGQNSIRLFPGVHGGSASGGKTCRQRGQRIF